MIQMVPSTCVNQSSRVPESTALVAIQCQADSFARAASSRVPVLIDHLQRAMELRRRSGWMPTMRKILGFVQKQVRRLVSSSNKPQTANSVLDVPLALQAGELVEVKSAAEIAATLDASNSLKGLTFLPAMTQFCGQRYTVQKRMERMFLEESGTLRKLKNTVLLKDVACDGLLMRCDRYCLFYWREAWLKRVEQ
jgi:hypothetical protein